MKILNLIRYKNLLFLALIQWLIYFSAVVPILHKYGLHTFLPNAVFCLIVLVTLLITAGGYVINDYFDLKIDRINRPEKVIIGEEISKKSAMSLYIFLTSAGVLLGVLTAFLLKSATLGFIFAVTAGMLWFYSSSYKRQFLVGNLIVAFCSALSILVILTAQYAVLKNNYGDELLRQPPAFFMLRELFRWTCGFAAFAFIFTLIREIVKDLQDIKGDSENECRTLPIVWGEKNAKIVVTCLLSAVILVMPFILLRLNLPNDNITFKYFQYTFVPLFAIIIVSIWRKDFNQNYKIASNLIKFMMLIGILYSLIFNYLMCKAYSLAFFGIFKII